NEVYGFITDVAEIAEEGWYGDPSWATPERAATFPTRIVDEIAARLEEIGALGDVELEPPGATDGEDR
ncbi:MAG TPA: hypothetical protein VE522_04220, partial [Actinomycetota bacterium]|nr:hypothetical protein [Actinomycetota bacterium]